MANVKGAAVIQDQLNRSMPVAKDAKLGDLLVAILATLNALAQAGASMVLTKAGLVIKAGSSTLAKAANPILANFAGAYVRKAANTDMAALVGTLATAKSAAWVFYIDSAGTLTTSAKTADAASHDAALALVPAVPAGLAQIGILVLDNATGSNFVGGTTALDAASLTATYYDTPGDIPAAAAVTLGDLASRS